MFSVNSTRVVFAELGMWWPRFAPTSKQTAEVRGEPVPDIRFLALRPWMALGLMSTVFGAVAAGALAEVVALLVLAERSESVAAYVVVWVGVGLGLLALVLVWLVTAVHEYNRAL